MMTKISYDVIIVTGHNTPMLCGGSFIEGFKIGTKTIEVNVAIVLDAKQKQHILLMVLKQQMQ